MKLRPLHLLSLALLIAMCGCGEKTPTTATTTIPSGLDLFQTDPETTFFNFEKMPIPAGFFGADSQPFTGTVKFRGGPLPSSYFNGQEITQVDTIVKREQPVTMAQSAYPGYGTTPVEMVALSLVSEEPITVKAGQKEESWDIVVELSKQRPSRGTMNIARADSLGGTFESQLTVYPVFRFIRQRDGAEKILDTGAMELTKELQERLTLRATQVPWRHIAPPKVLTIKGLNDNFIAGAPARFKEAGEACAHGAQEPVEEPTISCRVSATRDDTVPGRFKAVGFTTAPGANVEIRILSSGSPCDPVNALPIPFITTTANGVGIFVLGPIPTVSGGSSVPGVGKQVVVTVSKGGKSAHCCAVVKAGDVD